MATDTRTQILVVAERLVQTRGYNAFSYAGVATELGPLANTQGKVTAGPLAESSVKR